MVVSLAALGTLVWVEVDQFDARWQELVALLVGVLSVVAGAILLAGF